MLIRKNLQTIILGLFLVTILISRWTGKPLFQPDSFTYMATADSILQGKGYLEEWGRGPSSVPLLYPWLIAIGESWFGMDAQTVAFLVSVLSSTALILLVFLWSVRRHGWKWAWVTVLLVAFNTSLMIYGLMLLTESLFTLLFFAATGISWVLLRRKGHPLLWLGAGFFTGLSIITKYAGWVLPVIILGWMTFLFFRKERTLRQSLYGGVAMILGVLLITQPVAWKGKIPGGGGELSVKKSLVNQLTLPDLRNEMERERYLAALTQGGDQFQVEVSMGLTLYDLLISRGGEIARRFILNLTMAIQSLFVLIPWWILIWIPVGILIQWIRWDIRGLVFSIFIVAICLGFIGFYALAGAYTSALGAERYMIPLIPLLIFWTTTGLWEVYRQLERFGGNYDAFVRIGGTGVVILLIVLNLFHSIPYGKRLLFKPKESKWDKSGSEVIGRWIYNGYGAGQKIMIREPSIPFYADGLWVITPFEPIERVIAFARRKGVRLIIIRRHVETKVRPHLTPLLRKDFTYSGIRLVMGLPNRSDSSVIDLAIYELQDGYKNK